MAHSSVTAIEDLKRKREVDVGWGKKEKETNSRDVYIYLGIQFRCNVLLLSAMHGLPYTTISLELVNISFSLLNVSLI